MPAEREQSPLPALGTQLWLVLRPGTGRGPFSEQHFPNTFSGLRHMASSCLLRIRLWTQQTLSFGKRLDFGVGVHAIPGCVNYSRRNKDNVVILGELILCVKGIGQNESIAVGDGAMSAQLP